MATIYLDMGLPEHQEGCYRVFNWAKASTEVKTSDSELTSPRHIEQWSQILPCLGQEALNMRQVCTYFRNEKFRPFYEMSPIKISDNFTFLFSYYQIASYLQNRELELFTNVSIDGNPQNFNLKASCICPTHLSLYAQKMPRLQSLSTVYLYMPSDYDCLKSVTVNLSPISQIFCHLREIRWDLFLNPVLLPGLQKLRFEEAFTSLGLDQLKPHVMSGLRFLHLSAKILEEYGSYSGISMKDILRALRHLPLLEDLHLKGVFSVEWESINLEPESLPQLKRLSLQSSQINPTDLRILLAAAPSIQELTFIDCPLLENAFENYSSDALTKLQLTTMFGVPVIDARLPRFLEAFPNLEEIDIKYLPTAGDDESTLPFKLYPSVRDLSVNCCGDLKKDRLDPVIDMIERMSSLQRLHLTGVKVNQTQIDESLPEAYTQLTRLVVSRAHLTGSYLTDMLNRAKGLKFLEWIGSTCDWMFQKLDDGALGQLNYVSIDNVKTSPLELISLFQKAVQLKELRLGNVTVDKTEGDVDFLLPDHSLPTLTHLYITPHITKQQAQVLLRAASNLRELLIPKAYLTLCSELSDGYFPDLEKISLFGELEEALVEIFPTLQRVAPTLKVKGPA